MINGDHKRGFFKRSWNKKRDFFFFGSIVAEMWGDICNFQDIKNKKKIKKHLKNHLLLYASRIKAL